MDFLKRLPATWQSYSSGQKSISIVITVCLVLAAYFFFRWLTQTEYAALYTNVQAENAGKIVEVLQGINVPYNLADEGKTILIPKERVYEVRLQLAGKGVIAEGGPGFELFDTNNLGSTDYERSINYQRALQEELRRTIVQIDAVKQARVHLVLPKKSTFIENQNKPQASIVVELNPLVTLEAQQVKAIAQLVAGSVEDLSYEDVNIVDTGGHILSDSIKKAAASGLELTQFEIKRDIEKNLEERIQQLLKNIYGPDKTVTMVTAELDFNQKETDSTVWGTEGVIASEQFTQSSITTLDSLPVGDPNRISDLAGGPEATGVITDLSSIKNYEINRVVEREVHTPGRLISISAAVVIDGSLTQETREHIEEVIRAAIGFNAERGDTISVLSTVFDQGILDDAQAVMAETDAAARAQEQMQRWQDLGVKGGALIVFLILGILLLRMLKPRQEWPELEIAEPVSIKTVEQQIEQLGQKSSFFTEDEKVKKIFKEEPEVVVQIINNWLDNSKEDASG